MAGSISYNQVSFGRKRSVIARCTSDASGDVNSLPVYVQGGDLYAFGYVPVSGASDLWDLTLKATYTDRDGNQMEWADILSGDGANLSNSTNGGWVQLSTQFQLIPTMKLQPIVSNLGNVQSVNLVFHFWEEVRV